MKRIMLAGSVCCALISGCGASVEEKMISVCTDIAKMSVADPASIVVNSVSSVQAHPTAENLLRFASIQSNGKLSVDQKAAFDVQVKELNKIKEVYAEVDFTDKTYGSRRDKATCWFMDRGLGFQLGSASVSGKGYSGISLMSLFVGHSRPHYLNSLNIIE
ncbi:hypothetical protein [Pseudomonas qingdaonensis]|uniref:hypothetical protein n=1 Tax=Pseudomonas qingdaonensis TaxID=2056231 RepID=UPI0028ACB412|nr:hypothetical protein [Pseudomonas qingdaonensis]